MWMSAADTPAGAAFDALPDIAREPSPGGELQTF
jgi:hypothetical protein